MAENLIEKTIKEYILEKNSVFVFPTQIAADLWADRIIQISENTAVPMEKFIAWDQFKGEAVRGENQTKDTVPGTMRSIFAAKLIEENGENPFFKSLIVPEFAKTAGGFVNWISGILPGLNLWKEYSVKKGGAKDDEDQDLEELYKRYSEFLEKYNLFDPAWERPPFKSNGNHYILFYPEILQDWEEYKTILEAAKDFITVVNIPENISDSLKDGTVKLFNNARVEIKNVATYLRNIHEEGIKWTDICVSVPDLDEYGPYLERELELLEIPHVLKQSVPLSANGAGNLFKQIKNCIDSGFSFDSVKGLVLNKELPWGKNEGDDGLCEKLVSYGRKNHCLCSYNYQNRKIDVWNESFKIDSDERLQSFYSILKKAVNRFAQADSFLKVREAYFAFRRDLLNMENCSEKSNNILSRCVAELGSLIDLEEKFTECEISNHFGFFVDYLDGCNYLPQIAEGGVQILPYKTASIAPFACHVVVDASQASLNVVYKELGFLNEHKRMAILNREETNVSEKYIRLYQMNSYEKPAYFTCSVRTISGYSQASSYLKEDDLTKIADVNSLYPENPYNPEKDWFLEKALFPGKIAATEKKSLENWLKLQKSAGEKNVVDSLLDNGKIRVSKSSMDKFYKCPRMWMFEQKLEIEEQENAAVYLDSATSGTLYHKILELFCDTLKEKNLPLTLADGELSSEYKQYLLEAIDKAIEVREWGNENSYLTKEVIKTIKPSVEKTAEASVTELCSVFDGCVVDRMESWGSEENTEKNYKFSGRVDCILKDPKIDQYFLVDFKLGNAPGNSFIVQEQNEGAENQIIAENLPLEEQELPDFQMAAYVYLMRKSENPVNIKNAAFFKVNPPQCVPVFGKHMFLRANKEEDNTPTIEEFEPTIQKMLECVDNFVNRVRNGNFDINPNVQTFNYCAGCTYNCICRKTYNVGGNK